MNLPDTSTRPGHAATGQKTGPLAGRLRQTVCALVLLLCGAVQAQLPDRFLDPDDGMLDLSKHLLEHKGILPVPIIITEPAVGYGGGLVGVFFDQPLGEALRTSLGETGKAIPPNMTAVGGFATQNGSRGGLLGHHHTWERDSYRYLGGIGKVELNLNFYGLLGKPRAYSLESVAMVQQLLARVARTDWFVGGRYVWAQVNPAFGNGWPADLEGRPLKEMRIGLLSLVVDHDTSNNIFSPTAGHFVEAELGAASPNLGGTTRFQHAKVRGFHWQLLGRSVVLGLRGDLQASSDDTPFFIRPYVGLRGVAAQRYQDQNAAAAEAELWWKFDPRWSVLAFGGAGRAWGQRDDFQQAPSATAVGAGFRYLIAKTLGIHAGIDIARGPQGNVIYLQVGSPWR